MMRRWLGVAVIAGCLSLAPAARAQYSPLPEPIPVCPDAGPPNLVPGPISPLAAPQGPPDALSLPDDGTGAFPCKQFEPEEAYYFNVGTQLFARTNLPRRIVAEQDPSVLRLDTGIAPPAGLKSLQEFSDINPQQSGGPKATFGYLFNTNQAVEVTGFYIPQSNKTASVQDPGRIDSFFVNPPLGFEGDNGLWLQADRMSTTLSTTVFGGEANYRYTDAAVTGAELIVGVRYLDLNETLANTTDDDGIQFPLANGQSDPTRVATYSVQAHNRLIAPQLGFEWDKSCTKWLTFGVMAKGAWGADFVDLNRQLIRGDGFVGFQGARSTVQFGQMYEFNAFVDINILERARLRFGYNAMCLFNVANVGDQFDFNLQNTNNFNNLRGSVFLQGPMAELQFLF